MRVWIAASLTFFFYVPAVATVMPGLTRRARILAGLGSFAGLALALAAHAAPPIPLLHDWLVPPVLFPLFLVAMIVAYAFLRTSQ